MSTSAAVEFPVQVQPGAAADTPHMERALALAARGEGRVEPNPPVGAVLVDAGGARVLGEGWHGRYGGPHAEVEAIADACRRGGPDAARGATLYLTLEPCDHQGKTPPCTQAILHAGIRRVVVACADPNPVTSGRGLARLKAAGLQVEMDLASPASLAARRLIAPFHRWVTAHRPWVVAKWAMSLDGRIATAAGESRWISGEASRREVHLLRARVGAVVVGLGTVLADDPLLTARLEPGQDPDAGWDPPRRPARRVVLDSRGRLPLDSRLVAGASEAPVWVAVGGEADPGKLRTLQARGLRVERTGDGPRTDPAALLERLAADGVTQALVEGGSGALGAFFERGLVDRALVYVAPVVLGGSGAPGPLAGAGVSRLADAMRFDRVDVRHSGDDVVFDAWREVP